MGSLASGCLSAVCPSTSGIKKGLGGALMLVGAGSIYQGALAGKSVLVLTGTSLALPGIGVVAFGVFSVIAGLFLLLTTKAKSETADEVSSLQGRVIPGSEGDFSEKTKGTSIEEKKPPKVSSLGSDTTPIETSVEEEEGLSSSATQTISVEEEEGKVDYKKCSWWELMNCKTLGDVTKLEIEGFTNYFTKESSGGYHDSVSKRLSPTEDLEYFEGLVGGVTFLQLNRCENVTNKFLQAIRSGAHSLKEIVLSDCERIDQKGAKALIREKETLKKVTFIRGDQAIEGSKFRENVTVSFVKEGEV